MIIVLYKISMYNCSDIILKKELINMIDISVKEAEELISTEKDLLILDVRTHEEYVDGHLENSKLIPLGKLPLDIDELYGLEDTPILVYCRSGGRSYQASLILENNGFRKIYNMLGGYTKWEQHLGNK